MEAKKFTDGLRACNTIETPAIKASRGERFHVTTTGACAGFSFGFATSAEAVAHTSKMGSDVVIWDTETDRRHARQWQHNHKWCPAFDDSPKDAAHRNG